MTVLNDFPWFATLDPVRQGVIVTIGIDRLNQPMRVAMQYSNWIAAAFEIWNSRQLLREMGEDRCKDLANRLEFGY